jgi:hypothetical protein
MLWCHFQAAHRYNSSHCQSPNFLSAKCSRVIFKPHTDIILATVILQTAYLLNVIESFSSCTQISLYCHSPNCQSAKCFGAMSKLHKDKSSRAIFKPHTDTILATVILQTANQLNVLESFSNLTHNHSSHCHSPNRQSAKCYRVMFKPHSYIILATVILQTFNQLNVL